MRILLACLQAPKTYRVSAYKHWELYFKRGMEEAGHTWVEVPDVDWIEPLVSGEPSQVAKWREQTWQRTIEFVRQEHKREPIHLFLGYLYPQMVEPGAIRDLQQMGIPCVNFFCDNVREFTRVPAEYRCFDLHWVPEYQALGMYKTAGLECLHAAMPCWVPPDQRTFNHPETEGITFIGSPDDLRRQLLGEAIQLGADLNIFGIGWNGELPSHTVPEKTLRQFVANQWQDLAGRGLRSWLLKFERRFHPLPPPPAIPASRLRGKLSPDDFVRVMQQSLVTIGINRVTTHYRSLHNPLTYSRLRDIEAPMLGACYLTEWAEDLQHLYDIGEEIETYRAPEELKEKLEALKKSPEKRQTMRRRGQARALTEHTVGNSLGKISERLNLKPARRVGK